MSRLREQLERDLCEAIQDMECECAEEHKQAFDALLARLEAAEGEGARLRRALEEVLTYGPVAWAKAKNAASEALAQSEGLPS